MYEYLSETHATNIVGSYQSDTNKDFNDEIVSLYENFKTARTMDIWSDCSKIVGSRALRNEYKQQLLGDVLNEQSFGNEHLDLHKDRVSQLFENTANEMVNESTIGQMSPIVGLTLPILKKNYYENVAKEIVMTEVPDQPFVKLQFERTFLRDNQGNKYYVPDVFYSDQYQEVYKKSRGVDLATAIPAFQVPGGTVDVLALATTASKTYSVGKFDQLAHDFCINVLEITAAYGAGNDQTVSVTAADATEATALLEADGFVVSGTPVVNATDATLFDATVTGEKIILKGLKIQPNEAADGMFSKTVTFTPRLGEGALAEQTDTIFGQVKFYDAKVSTSVQTGLITGYKFGGHLSNEKNENSVSLDYERTSKDIKIADGERINTGLTLEKIRDSKALLNIDISAKLVTDINEILTQFEDNNILNYLRDSYDDWKHRTDLPFGYGSHTDKASFVETAKFSLEPPAGATFMQQQWIREQMPVNINQLLEQLKTKINNKDMMFVIYGNPKNISLIAPMVKWIIDEDTKIGGVQLQYKFGVLTSSQSRCHVVSSQKIRESESLRIAAYPLTKEVVTFKHYKYSVNIENTYRNPDMPLVPNVMATQRYTTFDVLPIQGRFVFINNSFGNMNPVNIFSEEPGYYGPAKDKPFNSVDDFDKFKNGNN